MCYVIPRANSIIWVASNEDCKHTLINLQGVVGKATSIWMILFLLHKMEGIERT